MAPLDDKVAAIFATEPDRRGSHVREALELAWSDPTATAAWITAQKPPTRQQRELLAAITTALGAAIDYGHGALEPWIGRYTVVRLDHRTGRIIGWVQETATPEPDRLVAAFTQALVMSYIASSGGHNILENYNWLVGQDQLPPEHLGLGAAIQIAVRRSVIGVSGALVSDGYFQSIAPGLWLDPGTFQGLFDWQFARFIAIALNHHGQPGPAWEELSQLQDIRHTHR